jgi:hypothetical protein
MSERKIKISNPNKHRVGLRLMDGIRELVVHPNSFTALDESEIYFINSMSRIFSSKHLVIEDETISQDLGYSTKSVESLSNGEIIELLKGNILKLKKELDTITEKHIIDKVIEAAKTIDDLAKNKITLLQEWSGYDFDQLVEDDKKDEKSK